MKRHDMVGLPMTTVCCVALLAVIVGATQAQTPKQAAPPDMEEISGLEPKLQPRVSLTLPTATLNGVLSELTARTSARTHLDLRAGNDFPATSLACYVAEIPLWDVMDGLATVGSARLAARSTPVRWTLEHGDTLSLTPLAAGPNHGFPRNDYDVNRIAYYGMRLVRAVHKQPADMEEALKQLVRLSTLPSAVQESVQLLVKANAQGSVGPLKKVQTPLDPTTTGVMLVKQEETKEPVYMLRVNLTQQVDNRPFDLIMNTRFTPAQAAAYRPTPQFDTELPELGEGIRRDRRFGQQVTMELRNAPLSETLKSLFAATHLPLIAEVTERPANANLFFAKPANQALDLICAAYGYEWQRRPSGVIVLTLKQP